MHGWFNMWFDAWLGMHTEDFALGVLAIMAATLVSISPQIPPLAGLTAWLPALPTVLKVWQNIACHYLPGNA